MSTVDSLLAAGNEGEEQWGEEQSPVRSPCARSVTEKCGVGVMGRGTSARHAGRGGIRASCQ